MELVDLVQTKLNPETACSQYLFFLQTIIAKKFMGEPRAAKSQSASSTGAEKGKNKEKEIAVLSSFLESPSMTPL